MCICMCVYMYIYIYIYIYIERERGREMYIPIQPVGWGSPEARALDAQPAQHLLRQRRPQ